MPYNTKLSPDEEARFRVWKAKNAPGDSGVDYDLRGAFKAGVKPDPKTGHWPDTYKKPNHPTFSVESKYAVGDDKRKAGSWLRDIFIPPITRAYKEEPKYKKRNSGRSLSRDAMA